MSTNTTDPNESEADRGNEETDRLELAAQVELLAEENRRLREEYSRARQSQYRRTAAGLGAVGICAVLAAVVFPDGREVLFALAAVGLFGGILTYYLTPERFVAADVGERIYAGMAANETAVVEELGLSGDRIYLSTGDAERTRLYVPQQPRRVSDALPDEIEGPILTDPDTRGLALVPTGATLFEEFERTVTDDLAATPAALATQLADGLVEQFELAGGAEPDVDPTAGRATVAISDSAFGDVDRFDHPIASFLAVGFVAGLDRPIRLEVTPGDERADWLVTCRWDETEESEDVTGDATAADDADGTAATGSTAEQEGPDAT